MIVKSLVAVPSNKVTGTIQAGKLDASGSYPEDKGTTTSHYVLTIKGPREMVGTEFWSYVDPSANQSCPNGTSDVAAAKS